MTKILFVGNCQMCICQYLETNMWFRDAMEVRLHYVFEISVAEMKELLDEINQFQYIVTQSVSREFRGDPIFSTANMLERVDRKRCTIIMIPSCFFDFCFPFSYMKEREYMDRVLDNLLAHYPNVRDSLSKYLDIISDTRLFSEKEIEARYENSLFELEQREMSANLEHQPDHFIYITDFIKRNRGKILFYTINHPTSILLSFLATETLQILQKKKGGFGDSRDKDRVIDMRLDPLNRYRCPIPQVFQPFFETLLSEYNKNLIFRGKNCDIKVFGELYARRRRGIVKQSTETRVFVRARTRTRKGLLFANKNIYPGMESKIMKCIIPRKTLPTQSDARHHFVKCVSTSSMNLSDSSNHHVLQGETYRTSSTISGQKRDPHHKIVYANRAGQRRTETQEQGSEAKVGLQYQRNTAAVVSTMCRGQQQQQQRRPPSSLNKIAAGRSCGKETKSDDEMNKVADQPKDQSDTDSKQDHVSRSESMSVNHKKKCVPRFLPSRSETLYNP